MIDKFSPEMCIQRHKQELLNLLDMAKEQVEKMPTFDTEGSALNDNAKRKEHKECITQLRRIIKVMSSGVSLLALELPTKSEKQ